MLLKVGFSRIGKESAKDASPGSQHGQAYLLLRNLLASAGLCADAEVKKDELGKPFLPAYPLVHMSISHCKEAVAAVIADRETGIDVEKRFPYREELAKRVLSEKEFRYCAGMTPQERERALQLIWSRKESFLKCIGTGIRRDLREFSLYTEKRRITLLEGTFVFWQRQEDDFTICLCCKEHIYK